MRTPSAHWVPNQLNKRVPYTDPPFKNQYDPYEISLGNGHREIAHLLEIIDDQQATQAQKIKALRLLDDVISGHEEEAIQHNAFEVLQPLLKDFSFEARPPNGLLLNNLIVLNKLLINPRSNLPIASDIPRIASILNPDMELPLRLAAATCLHTISEHFGVLPQFLEEGVPIKLVQAAASSESPPSILKELFSLLSRLTNNQNIRVPLIESQEFLQVLVKSISNPSLQDVSMNLAENIAMDSSHNGKKALLDAEILDYLPPILSSKSISKRMSAVSLIALLAVPPEGKERIAMARDILDMLGEIATNDADLELRRSAQKARVIVAELPFAHALIGDIVDPSKPKAGNSTNGNTSNEK